MLIIFISLILGIIIGASNLLPERILDLTDYLTLGGLFLLLFTMGVKIGINQEVIANLDNLGLEAIILALGSVSGSVVLVLLFENFLKRGKEEC